MKCQHILIVFLIVCVSLTFFLSSVQAANFLIDSYGESNQDYFTPVKALHPTTGVIPSEVGQSFTSLSTPYSISSVKFYLCKYGSPTGMAHAVLYAHYGTYGTYSAPTGSPLATSNDFDVSTLPTYPTLQLVTFTFSSSQQYALAASTYYCIDFQNPTSGTINSSNYVLFGYDGSAPTHSGNYFEYQSSGWHPYSSRDGIFTVYGDAPSTGWKNVETWTIKRYGLDYVNVTISVTGSGTTSPTAGFYNITYHRGDSLIITAYPGVGYTYYGMVRNGILWTQSNPGTFLNLGNVGFQNESIQVIFMEWHNVESWQIRINAGSSWQSVESWIIRARTTVTWRVVESWTLKLYATSGFRSVENWTINLYAHTPLWYSVENWTILTNATSLWHTVETWTVSATTTELGFHEIETWTLNVQAQKQIIGWDPALQFYLSDYDTYVGFDDTVYFDNFTLASTYISFANIFMDAGSPIPRLTISMQGGNVSFGQIDYGYAMSFMFYTNQGSIVTLYLTGLDSTPYTVIIDGVPMPVDTGWSWDGATLTVSYVMSRVTSHVVLSWAEISTFWRSSETWNVGLNLPGAIVSGVTWYYRSNTIVANGISGYELSATMDNSLSSVVQNLGVSSDAVQFGFSVFLVNSRNVSVSLTGDIPTAIIIRSTVGEGLDSATVGVSDMALVLGMNTIDVKLYIRLASSTWLLSAEFTSQRLMYTRLVGSTWQFNLYTKTELDASNNVIASCYWADSNHKSGISGLSFQTPTPQELALYYAGQGNWLLAILTPYMIYAGDAIYGLGFLFVGGVLYLRHKKWEVILVCLFLFGGTGGVGLLIPDVAYRLLYVVVALALTWLLTRVFK